MARGVGARTGPWEVGADALIGWAGRQDWKLETRRCFRSSALQFYRWGIEAGRATDNPALRLPRVRPAEPIARPTPEHAYVAAVIGAPPRERLMLRLAAECGMRRGEVSRVHSDDLLQSIDGWSLIVHGKGGKDRCVPLPDSLAAELRALGAGYAFPGADKGHLSAAWVGKLVTRRLPGNFTMHTLRHRFGTQAYAVDRDILAVQALLGHASPVTTRRYVRVPDASLRRTIEAVQRIA
ncbi:tyrosine-type recombinase/integrase [Nocardia rhizosphaerae]|uniref:Tyrosine-type recombinase/integrase n=1 Tax=Nocardia rhizosphaerae TaxID=1691571 RepID=A0ABV8L9J2_9NOCA